MIDFSEYGTIALHKYEEHMICEFKPDDGKESTAQKMYQLLRDFAVGNGKTIGIFLTHTKKYPTPSCILFDNGGNNNE